MVTQFTKKAKETIEKQIREILVNITVETSIELAAYDANEVLTLLDQLNTIKCISNNQLEMMIENDMFTLRKDWNETKDGQVFYYATIMNVVTYEETTYQII